jgi:hypothetical protein
MNQKVNEALGLAEKVPEVLVPEPPAPTGPAREAIKLTFAAEGWQIAEVGPTPIAVDGAAIRVALPKKLLKLCRKAGERAGPGKDAFVVVEVLSQEGVENLQTEVDKIAAAMLEDVNDYPEPGESTGEFVARRIRALRKSLTETTGHLASIVAIDAEQHADCRPGAILDAALVDAKAFLALQEE